MVFYSVSDDVLHCLTLFDDVWIPEVEDQRDQMCFLLFSSSLKKIRHLMMLGSVYNVKNDNNL